MEIKSQTEVSFKLHVEVSPAYYSDILLFIYQKYIVPHYHRFSNVRRWILNGRETLAFTFLGPDNLWHVDIEVTSGQVMEIKMRPSSPEVPAEVLNKIKEDIIIAVQMFEDNIRRNTIYLVWGPEKRIADEKTLTQRKKILSQIFTGNMLLLFIIFILFSYFIFAVAGLLGILEYAPLILLLSQFILVLFADKIIMQMGDWFITKEHSKVYVLQYHIPPEDLGLIEHKYAREKLLQIKREIYERSLAIGKPIDVEIVREVFSKYNIEIKPENLLIKSVDIYKLVDEVAKKFGMPVPKIAVANIIVPNAAATGPRPGSSLVLITSGLLIQLDEEEMLAVIGHEISHVKGRDPLIFFLLASAEYLIRVYVILRYIPYIFFFFGFLYFFFALSLIYFIAKFFEARADLESAIVLGKADALANALRKIGYRRLLIERSISGIGAWLGMDPHPPISFRIERLEGLGTQKIKHPLLRSIKDCVRGLIREISS